MVLFTTTALADAGNFTSDFDWGGAGDWGGSSWDSDFGSDFGGYGGGIFIGALDWGWIIFVIIAIIVLASAAKKKKRSNSGGNNYRYNQNVSAGMPISLLKQKDPAFSEAALLDKIGNIYVSMQNSWENKEWEPMRAHMTDNLYNQFGRQLDELKARGYTNHMERICVINSFIKRYSQDQENDVLTVELTARLTDYTVDSQGNLVSGSRTAEKYLTYEWTLIRDKNAKTLDTEGMQTVSCPNCGAPVDVARSAKCEYCDTVITVDAQEWVISAIRGISQRTAG